MKPRLLLVDDDPGAIHVMHRMLGPEFELRYALGGEEALAIAREFRPQLVLLDAQMPGMSGTEVCRAIKADPTLADCPVVFVTALDQAGVELMSLELGAAGCVSKPLVQSVLLDTVRAQLRPPVTDTAPAGAAADAEPATPCLLIVDDDVSSVQAIHAALGQLNARFHFATDGRQALEMAARYRPDVVLLDIYMPGIDGLEVLRQIKGDTTLAATQVIVVTRYAFPAMEQSALEAGGTDFIAKPYTQAVLLARVRNVLRLREHTHAAVQAEREHWQRISDSRLARVVGAASDAIVTADLTTPRVDLHGEGVFRIFDAGATAETGFAGGRGSAMLGGRFSFTSMVLSLLSPNVGLAHRDYQARVTYDLTPRDRISLVSFGAYDLLKDTTNGVETIVFGSEFYRLDLRYQRLLPNNGVLKWGTTLGYDQSRLGEQRNAQDKLFATRVFLTQPLHPKLTLKAGLDAQFDHYTADKRHWADPDDPDTIAYDNLFPPRDDEAFGAYADIDWQIDPRVKVTPGVRLDVFTSGGSHATSVSPRLSMTAQVHKKIRLLHAFGIATQPPAFVLPLPGLSIGKLSGGLQTSVQSSFGVEAQLPLSITATVSVFDNVFLNMSDTLSVQRPGNAFESDPRSLGYSRGLEVYARTRFTQKLGGFVSYTLSESIRKIGESTFPSAFDRRHVLNAALGYTFPLKIRAGARVTFYTGAPDVSGPTATVPTDPLNPPRNPSFFRLDLRLEKKWEYRNQRWLSLVIEMINSTLSTEVISGQEIGPISIPSIGAEGGF
jgi:CheY-like chemotaxis protein